MNFDFTEEQLAVRDAVTRICQNFDDEFWLERDRDGRFPEELHQALAEGGWLSICMPEEYGGAGLGITEAAIMMRTISESGAGMTGASAIHMNIFGLNPVVVFGTDEQKSRMLPPLIAGKERACFAVTEPDAGLDTTRLKTRAERRGDRYVINGQKVWISTAQVAEKILILARTTPLEDVRKPTEGLSLFYTDLNRDCIEVREIEKMGRKAVDSNQVVSPGATIVPRVLARAQGRYASDINAHMALNRRVEAHEVADSVEFLLSDRASAITGIDILVDAGLSVAGDWGLYGGVPQDPK